MHIWIRGAFNKNKKQVWKLSRRIQLKKGLRATKGGAMAKVFSNMSMPGRVRPEPKILGTQQGESYSCEQAPDRRPTAAPTFRSVCVRSCMIVELVSKLNRSSHGTGSTDPCTAVMGAQGACALTGVPFPVA